MDKIFTQKELYWLDDILPGTHAGKIRRSSTSRNVHITYMSEDLNNPNQIVSIILSSINSYLFLIQSTLDHDKLESSLPNIDEVGVLKYMFIA